MHIKTNQKLCTINTKGVTTVTIKHNIYLQRLLVTCVYFMVQFCRLGSCAFSSEATKAHCSLQISHKRAVLRIKQKQNTIAAVTKGNKNKQRSRSNTKGQDSKQTQYFLQLGAIVTKC